MRDDNNTAAIFVCFFAVLVLTFIAGSISPGSPLRRDEVGIYYDTEDVYVRLSSGEELRTNDIDGIKYAFLPTYCKAMHFTGVDGQQTGDEGAITFGSAQPLTISRGTDILYDGSIVFYRSDNIYSTFIDLKDLDVSDMDKIYVDGNIRILAPNGHPEKISENMLIRCRGNSTFGKKKKAYTVKLSKNASVAGMAPSKKYYLLANAFDGSRLINKLVFDMMEKAGMEYTTSAVWTDLYINGEYRGNYMLCESIDVAPSKIDTAELEKYNSMLKTVTDDDHFESEDEKGYTYDKGPEDISGGYIIEKDIEEYYAESPCGFKDDSGTPFTIKYPGNASKEETEYIRSVVANIESLMASGSDELFNYIDTESFAKRYLIEELVLNSDAAITSYFFYKKSSDPVLYAGPGWDYDGAFGEMKEGTRNYHDSILDLDEIRQMDTLDWDSYLFNNNYYQKKLSEIYSELRPIFIDTYNTQIDNYAGFISASVSMDMARWPDLKSETLYQDYDNTIRYLKFFLYQRILFMDEMFDVQKKDITAPENTGSTHVVTICRDDESAQYEIPDGEFIKESWLGDYLDTPGYCWQYKDKEEIISFFAPVYEDVEIVYAPYDP